MAIIEFQQAKKVFRTGKKSITALNNVSLTVDRGDIFAIIGYSGAGKSTLVRLINGLETVTSGKVVVDGVQVSGASEKRLKAVRQNIGMIFQQFNLFNSRTVAGNVEYPLKQIKMPKAERRKRVAELLDFVNLKDRGQNYPEQLSGGQKQRVGIARALATNPKILLADESTSSLDPNTTVEVLRLLRKVNRDLGITVVVITHEMDVVREIANKVAILEKGRLVEKGKVFEVFSNPRESITESFVSTVVHNKLAGEDLALIRSSHSGRIFQVEVRGRSRIGENLSEAARRGVDFEVIFGGISQLQNQPFGRLTFQLAGDDQKIDETVRKLKQYTVVEEVFYPEGWLQASSDHRGRGLPDGRMPKS